MGMVGRQFVGDTLHSSGERGDSLYVTIENDSDGGYVALAIHEEVGEDATYFLWKPALQELVAWLAEHGMIEQRPTAPLAAGVITGGAMLK